MEYLRALNRRDELDYLFDSEEPFDNYTWYVYIELLPMFDSLRRVGKLRNVVNTHRVIGGEYCQYSGELDEKLQFCGHGELKNKFSTKRGTFLND